MEVFPNIQEPSGISITTYKPQLKTEFEANYMLVRPLVNRARKMFNITWAQMPSTDFDALNTFFEANQGTFFSWTNPINTTTYTVCFSEDTLIGAFVSVGQYSVQLKLEGKVMLVLNSETISEKNKLSSDAIMSVLLEANLGENGIFRFCDNNINITWKGNTFLAYNFKIDEITDTSTGEVQQFSVTVDNRERSVEAYLQQVDGGVGSTVFIYVVNTKLLETNPYANAEVTIEMVITAVTTTAKEVTFTMGVGNPYNKRLPQDRLLKNSCRFRFKSPFCKYTGPATVCNKTLAQCRLYNNSVNFGAYPG